MVDNNLKEGDRVLYEYWHGRFIECVVTRATQKQYKLQDIANSHRGGEHTVNHSAGDIVRRDTAEVRKRIEEYNERKSIVEATIKRLNEELDAVYALI